jgi:hypothetical protein
MVMSLTVLALVAAVLLVVGFAAGARFEEINLQWRERTLARERRMRL